MSPIKPHFDRLAPALRRAASRVRGGHAVAFSVIVAAAFGLAGLRTVDLPGPRPISDGDRLRIEVVHPVEPEIVAGSVMDVGELVDGFQGLPPPLPPLTDAAWYPGDGWEDEDEAWPPPRSEARRVAEIREYGSRPEPESERPSPMRAVQRWFGFDAPRRDFRAERAARRARMEAMEREARERYARERYAAERFRRDRDEEDRHAFERRRAEVREAPPWRDDRPPSEPYGREYGPPPDREREAPRRQAMNPSPESWDPPAGPSPYPPPPGPRPYDGWGR